MLLFDAILSAGENYPIRLRRATWAEDFIQANSPSSPFLWHSSSNYDLEPYEISPNSLTLNDWELVPAEQELALHDRYEEIIRQAECLAECTLRSGYTEAVQRGLEDLLRKIRE